MDQPLSQDEQKILLDIARESITRYLRDGIRIEATRTEQALNQRRGCFVTLGQDDQLRGCIGSFVSDKPLCDEVAAMAIAAATADPRFYPMREEDLDNFSIDISVLSPLRKTEDPQEIVVGLHGIYIEKDGQRGVLLPQVAVEQGWDREAFLQHTCHKAGLPKEAWQSADCAIHLFSAQIIKED